MKAIRMPQSQRRQICCHQVFLVGPLEDLQPGGAALDAVTKAHARFRGRFAFATATVNTDPADMLINFFGVERRPSEIQVRPFCSAGRGCRMGLHQSILGFCWVSNVQAVSMITVGITIFNEVYLEDKRRVSSSIIILQDL